MFTASNIIGSFAFDHDKIVEEILFGESELLENYHILERNEIPKEELELQKKHNAKPADKRSEERFLELLKGKHIDKFYLANILIAKEKIKNSVHEDTLLMQAINNVDELDKCANLLAKRLREWYELYNPETSKEIEDHEKFINTILEKGKDELQKESKIKFSMGAPLNDEHIKPMRDLAEKIKEIYKLRDSHRHYVEIIMKKTFPNIEAIAGAQIGAKLIAQAGGITRLSEFPSSTLQLLGAEKALFRHMKTGSRPPKYGILINHPFITNANKENKGKIARLLANKLSIAAKVDNFSGEFIGDKLKKEIEEKIKNKL